MPGDMFPFPDLLHRFFPDPEDAAPPEDDYEEYEPGEYPNEMLKAA